MTGIEKKAEQAAVELLKMTGWMFWHDYFLRPDAEDKAEPVDLEAEVFPEYDDDRVLYIEMRGDVPCEPVRVSDRTTYGDRFITMQTADRRIFSWKASEHNRMWRLWTGNPTEEQRGEWAWDA